MAQRLWGCEYQGTSYLHIGKEINGHHFFYEGYEFLGSYVRRLGMQSAGWDTPPPYAFWRECTLYLGTKTMPEWLHIAWDNYGRDNDAVKYFEVQTYRNDDGGMTVYYRIMPQKRWRKFISYAVPGDWLNLYVSSWLASSDRPIVVGEGWAPLFEYADGTRTMNMLDLYRTSMSGVAWQTWDFLWQSHYDPTEDL